tara:strand:- start:330 stop:935 length:606 start_codon:yes stop_codon:yes gene_type:complete
MEKLLLLLIIPFFSFGQCIDGDFDNDGICDEIDDCIGTWIADITSGNCDQFTAQGADVCNSYSGCEWTYSWGGWFTGGSSDCVGTYEIDNEYCDELVLNIPGCIDTDACNYDPNAIEDDGSCEYPGDECEGFDLQLQSVVYGILDEFCECGLPLSIDMLLENKKIIKVVNVFGQKSQIHSKEKILIHIYDDGTVEKQYLIK